ncbi:polyprenyl synthetase family protein [Clostridium magnum]|uniref:Octaprenyl-diphosphate synthase n=1 Tax=Clostridium magnum DSM 2767 TaxID=1121326 RepID=A0A162TRI8_9CLOT|nr:polyprenyl synthetase family protein [Clostridium magnum]KZL92961.1 octaprenyl-diphosphate synthase [Clostridium magnum DSM 2767]SHJ21317.1 octaprenyl-diphosphate synthase [Clostridium magnum DSM 2767]
MRFDEISILIIKELNQFESELKNIASKLDSTVAQDIFTYFFSIPGKRLRPTLTFLCAGAINGELTPSAEHNLIQLAIGLELIHSASLIHDDIIDGDLLRRGQKTLNKTFGNKIAVLAGDALYSRAFTIFSDTLPREFAQVMGRVTESMSVAEILNANNPSPDRETYFEIILGKTASFMSACCMLGARIVGATEEECNMLSKYGKNLGMAYQILDDYIDEDSIAMRNVTIEEGFEFAYNAKASIENLKDSAYKQSLIMLVDYVLDFYSPKVENAL